MGPGLLPALFPQPLIPVLEGGGDPVSVDFPLQLRFPDAQSQSRHVGPPGAQPFLSVQMPGSPLTSALALKDFP